MNLLEKIAFLFQRRVSPKKLLSRFDRDCELLKHQFFEKARTAGVPRGLRWVRCDWLPGRVLLRDRATSQICLLAGINVSFEAVEGGDMEDVAAVSMLRDACAVFHFEPAGWQTSGRALFNMNPDEASVRLNSSHELCE